MEEEKLHAFIEIAGLETEEEFYAAYPTEEDFFEAFPEARNLFPEEGEEMGEEGMEQFNFGGNVGAISPDIADLIMKLSAGQNNNSMPMMDETMKAYNAYKNSPGTIYSPDQAMYENQMNLAYAQTRAENPLTQTLDTIGNIGMKTGTGMMGQEGNFDGWNKKKAFGGGVGGTPVEVEGDEVAELPKGGLMDFEGPTHEQGGIPVELPSGTHIFSDRIKIDGITTADRKKKRDKKEKKLEKTFADNVTDMLVKNALERTKETNQKEEQFDKSLQEEVENYMNPQEEPEMAPNMMPPEMMGGEQFQWGGGVPTQYKDMMDALSKIQQNESKAPVTPVVPVNWGGDAPYYNGMMDVISKIQSGEIKSTGDQDTGKTKSTGEKGGYNFLENNPYSAATFGDAMGIAGNLYQAYSPLRTTMEQRAGDVPNMNLYENYGKEGLQTLQNTKDFIIGNKERAQQELELARVANSRRNRNAARGVNTMRALDIAGDVQMDSAQRGLESDFASQMMNVMGQESQMQNNIDQVTMGGAQAADVANRHDRGQFYTNLARDRVSLGEGLARTGKSLNQIQRNTSNEEMLSNLSELINYNIKTGKTTAKIGIQTLASQHGDKEGFKTFEKLEAWKDVGIENKKQWEELSEKEKQDAYRKYLTS